MSVKILSQALDTVVGDSTRKLVLICLADHANEDDRTCWPAIDRIAKKCEISRSTVKRHIKVLEQDGLIMRRSRTGDSTLYYVLPRLVDGTERPASLAEMKGGVQFEPGSPTNRGVVHSYEPGGGSPVNPKPSITINEPSIHTVDRFAEFWSVYPKREGSNPRKPAHTKYLKAVKAGTNPDDIINGARAYANHCRSKGSEGTVYVAQAVTWLNQERWTDEHAQSGDDEFAARREAARRELAAFNVVRNYSG